MRTPLPVLLTCLALPVVLPCLALLGGCWAPELAGSEEQTEEGSAPSSVTLTFVDGGVVVPAEVEAEGQLLPEGRVLVSRDWTPGAEVEILGGARRVIATAPAEPRCLMLFRVGIGAEPPTELAWAEPESGTLRMKRVYGDLVVVDAWRGQPVRSDPIPEPPVEAPVPARCPTEKAAETGVIHPDGHRIAVVEGPFEERSGDVGWRVAVYR